jgi:hypothetical protein
MMTRVASDLGGPDDSCNTCSYEHWNIFEQYKCVLCKTALKGKKREKKKMCKKGLTMAAT